MFDRTILPMPNYLTSLEKNTIKKKKSDFFLLNIISSSSFQPTPATLLPLLLLLLKELPTRSQIHPHPSPPKEFVGMELYIIDIRLPVVQLVPLRPPAARHPQPGRAGTGTWPQPPPGKKFFIKNCRTYFLLFDKIFSFFGHFSLKISN